MINDVEYGFLELFFPEIADFFFNLSFYIIKRDRTGDQCDDRQHATDNKGYSFLQLYFSLLSSSCEGAKL